MGKNLVKISRWASARNISRVILSLTRRPAGRWTRVFCYIHPTRNSRWVYRSKTWDKFPIFPNIHPRKNYHSFIGVGLFTAFNPKNRLIFFLGRTLRNPLIVISSCILAGNYGLEVKVFPWLFGEDTVLIP